MWRTGGVVRGIPAIHHPPMAVHQYNRNGIVPAQLLDAVQHSKDVVPNVLKLFLEVLIFIGCVHHAATLNHNVVAGGWLFLGAHQGAGRTPRSLCNTGWL